MIVRNKNILSEGVPSVKLVQECIKEFLQGEDRLKKLADYFANKNSILIRQRPKTKINNRVVHPYAQYIVGIASGYLVGKPVQYTAEQEIEDLLAAYRTCNADSIDSELAESASVFGVGVELVYMDEYSKVKTAKVDRQSAFVVYDDTVAAKPLLGIRWVKYKEGEQERIRVFAYTANLIVQYTGTTVRDFREDGVAEFHSFGAVPLVEYWNNGKEEGDFECVIPLIDAYDVLQSDRVNDKEQFVDSLLVFYGVREVAPPEDENDKRPTKQRIKEDRILALPDGAKGEYLYKQLNEGDVEVLKKALASDIHKFSRVPDLTDENFAGNTSGVAMKYKLFGLEQLTRVKERWFAEGLRQRLRLFCNMLGVQGKKCPDPDEIQISFSRSLPTNDLEIMQVVTGYQGMVSNQTLLGQVPFVQDIELEEGQLAKEQGQILTEPEQVEKEKEGLNKL